MKIKTAIAGLCLLGLAVATPAKAEEDYAGFYGGFFGGFGGSVGGAAPQALVLSPSNNVPSYHPSKTHALMLGAFIGFNWVLPRVVLGVESDLAFTNTPVNFYSGYTTLHLIKTLRGRIGVPLGNALLYKTVGLALFAGWSQSSIACQLCYGGFTPWLGLVAGLGVEYALNERLGIRLEALKYLFRGPHQYNSQTLAAPPLAPQVNVAVPVNGGFQHIWAIRAGLSFRF